LGRQASAPGGETLKGGKRGTKTNVILSRGRMTMVDISAKSKNPPGCLYERRDSCGRE